MKGENPPRLRVLILNQETRQGAEPEKQKIPETPSSPKNQNDQHTENRVIGEVAHEDNHQIGQSACTAHLRAHVEIADVDRCRLPECFDPETADQNESDG